MHRRIFISIVMLLVASLSCQFLSAGTEVPVIQATSTPLPLPTEILEEVEQIPEIINTVAVDIPQPTLPPVDTPEPEATQTPAVNVDATAKAEADGELNAKGYEKRGDAWLDQGYFYEAIEDFTHAIALNKKSQSAFWHRGIAQYYLKNHEEALSDISEAIKLWPGQPNPYYWRGLVYYDMGEYQKALDEYDLAIQKTKLARWVNADWKHIYEARQKAEDALNTQ